MPLYIFSLPETLSFKHKIKHFEMQTFLTILHYNFHAVKYILALGFLYSASLPSADAHNSTASNTTVVGWGVITICFLITLYSLQEKER